MSEASLRRAFDTAWTAEPILRFLDAHATKGVPQPLSYLVEDVGRRYGRVRVGTAGCYIRSDEAALLAEILVARKAARLGLHPVAPTVLVSAVGAETVIATLRAAGYLPAEEDDSGALMVRHREVLRADEPSTGRFDGENYNLGLVDVTDRPYEEMVRALKTTHERLQAVHAGTKPPFSTRAEVR